MVFCNFGICNERDLKLEEDSDAIYNGKMWLLKSNCLSDRENSDIFLLCHRELKWVSQ